MRVGGKVFHQAHILDKSGSIPEHRYFATNLTVLRTLGDVETEESKTLRQVCCGLLVLSCGANLISGCERVFFRKT